MRSKNYILNVQIAPCFSIANKYRSTRFYDVVVRIPRPKRVMRKFQMSQTTRDRAEATEKGASLQEAIICLTPETSSVWWQLHYVLGFNV